MPKNDADPLAIDDSEDDWVGADSVTAYDEAWARIHRWPEPRPLVGEVRVAVLDEVEEVFVEGPVS